MVFGLWAKKIREIFALRGKNTEKTDVSLKSLTCQTMEQQFFPAP